MGSRTKAPPRWGRIRAWTQACLPGATVLLHTCAHLWWVSSVLHRRIVACVTLTPAVHTHLGGSDAPRTVSHMAWLGARGQWPWLGPHWELPGLPHSMEAGFQEQGASWKERGTGHLYEWVTVSLLRCSAGQANAKPHPAPGGGCRDTSCQWGSVKMWEETIRQVETLWQLSVGKTSCCIRIPVQSPPIYLDFYLQAPTSLLEPVPELRLSIGIFQNKNSQSTLLKPALSCSS